jgi:hypothetical protein
MKRRSFVKEAVLATGAATVAVPLIGNGSLQSAENAIHELRIYHISRASNAKNNLENYLSSALIPFFNKRNIKVGVFNEYSLEEPAKLYLLVTYPSLSAYSTTQAELLTDTTYIDSSKSFTELPFANATFTRYETFMLEAFKRFPSLVVPNTKKNLFELRLYESPTDYAGKIKVNMFEQGEIDIFDKYGLEPVFFGKIIAGQYMPALIYMVGFKDMAERDEIWAKFNTSPEWQSYRVKPEFPSGNVSNIRRIFLTPTAYSQI